MSSGPSRSEARKAAPTKDSRRPTRVVMPATSEVSDTIMAADLVSYMQMSVVTSSMHRGVEGQSQYCVYSSSQASGQARLRGHVH